jgi:hypothetical protein
MSSLLVEAWFFLMRSVASNKKPDENGPPAD